MKKIVYLLFLTLISCSSPKNVIYFSDAPRFEKKDMAQKYVNYIQKDDLLSIVVGSKSPDLALPFNPLLQTSEGNDINSLERGYLVSAQGNIIFPILGDIYVEGLTHSGLSELISKRLIDDGFIQDPTVTVKLLNYKISVLGEVNSPGIKKITTERVNIFEILSMAGDLTIFGKRDNISIIREENGKREIAYVDISSKNIFDSPYYFLRQNDIVYIEPNPKKEKLSVSNPTTLATIFSGAALLAAIINLLK